MTETFRQYIEAREDTRTMTQRELLEVIESFETAIAAGKTPKFKTVHRAEQVLRLLKVAYRTDLTRLGAVNEIIRAMWEDDGFWRHERLPKPERTRVS